MDIRQNLNTCRKSIDSYLEWNPERLCNWAYATGENVKLLTEKIIESKPHPEQAYKTILGIINLNKRFRKGKTG